MQRLLALILVFTFGCGTVLNGSTATVILPPGASIDGMPSGPMPMPISNRTPHEIVYPDGRRCLVTPHVSVGYLIADIVLLFLVGVIVDAVTGDWTVLDASMCPGVAVD